MLLTPGSFILTLVNFYSFLIFIYIILTWIPAGGAVDEIRYAIGRLVEPYLNLFRRFIPPMGMIDFTPIIAIFVLRAVGSVLAQVL